MIRTFRPWQIFEHLTNPKMELTIPTVPGTTSRTVFMLETAILIAAARIVKAKSILEIGTCMGYTAMHLAMNTDAKITSLDIQPRAQIWSDTPYADRISYRILPEQPDSAYDMVFVDACHDYAEVKADTEKALAVNPSVIAWHDYSNPSEPGVKKFLAEFSEGHNLIHVQDSWIVLWFEDDLK